MPGLAKMHLPVFREDRDSGLEFQGNLRFGDQEVDFAHVGRRPDQIRNIGPDKIAEFRKNMLDFLGFLGLQRGDLVLQFDDFDRLDKSGLSGRGGVIDKTLDFFLV